MNNDELNINDLNNAEPHHTESEEYDLFDDKEPIESDELQYEYLKDLNKRLTLFKKPNNTGKGENNN